MVYFTKTRGYELIGTRNFTQLLLVILCLTLFFQGIAMAAGKLISDVSAMEKPEKFRPTPIDNVVLKYIPIGTNILDVKQTLLEEGFIILPEKKLQSESVRDERTKLSAVYKYKKAIPIFPSDYKIVIDIIFETDKVLAVHGWYVAHAY